MDKKAVLDLLARAGTFEDNMHAVASGHV